MRVIFPSNKLENGKKAGSSAYLPHAEPIVKHSHAHHRESLGIKNKQKLGFLKLYKDTHILPKKRVYIFDTALPQDTLPSF